MISLFKVTFGENVYFLNFELFGFIGYQALGKYSFVVFDQKRFDYALGEFVNIMMSFHSKELRNVLDMFPSSILSIYSRRRSKDLSRDLWSVGKTEEELKEAKIPYKKGSFPFS